MKSRYRVVDVFTERPLEGNPLAVFPEACSLDASSTGPLAAYMLRHRLIAGTSGRRFVSEQGTKMGRRSILHVQLHGQDGADGIEVGGHVTPVVDATLEI